MLVMTYPGVPRFHPDEAPLDVLADILGGCKTTWLYKNFVKNSQAVIANASKPASELAGEFAFYMQPFTEVRLDSTEALLRRTLTEFETRGVTDDDIARKRLPATVMIA